MTSGVLRYGRASCLGELALWSTAGLVVLTAHIAAAAVLLRQEPASPADQGPPAAIMIELAAEAEAVNTEEDQVSTEEVDLQEVASKQLEPVEDPLPEPLPDPVEPPPPDEVVETVEPEPELPEPEPVEQSEPEITETIPEPQPEPVEEVDPLEQEMIAALEKVEVPLPVARPAPPPEPKKPSPRQAKPQPQASKASQQAKLQAKPSERTAASQTTAGSASSAKQKADWRNDARNKVARAAQRRRCPGTGTVAIRFSFDDGGNIISVSVTKSSGSSAIDQHIASAVQNARRIPAPPPDVANFLTVPLKCT